MDGRQLITSYDANFNWDAVNMPMQSAEPYGAGGAYRRPNGLMDPAEKVGQDQTVLAFPVADSMRPRQSKKTHARSPRLWRNFLMIGTIAAAVLWVAQLAAVTLGPNSRHWDIPLVKQDTYDEWGLVVGMMNATHHKMLRESELGASDEYVHKSFRRALSNSELQCKLVSTTEVGATTELCECLYGSWQHAWATNATNVLRSSLFCFSKRFHKYYVTPSETFGMTRVNPHIMLLWAQAISLSMFMLHWAARAWYAYQGKSGPTSVLYLCYGIIGAAVLSTTAVDLTLARGETFFWVFLLGLVTLGMFWCFWKATVNSTYQPRFMNAANELTSQDSTFLQDLTHYDLQGLLVWCHAAIVMTLVTVALVIVAGCRQFDVIIVTGLTMWGAMVAGAASALARSFIIFVRTFAVMLHHKDDPVLNAARQYVADGAWIGSGTATFALAWLLGFHLDTQWDTRGWLLRGFEQMPSAPWVGAITIILAAIALKAEFSAWFQQPALGLITYNGSYDHHFSETNAEQKAMLKRVFMTTNTMVTLMVLLAEMTVSVYVITLYGDK